MTRAAFQASSILRYSVILFWRFFVVGIDVFQSDEYPSHACARAFLDEIGKLVAERIHLDYEADIELLDLAQVDQAVEDRLPVLVSGKIVVGDEEAAHAFGVVEADDPLY